MAQLYSESEVDIYAQNRLMVSLREKIFRIDPNLAPDPNRITALETLLEDLNSQKLSRWYHIKFHLPTGNFDFEGAIRVCNQRWVLHGAYTFEIVRKDGSVGYPHVHLLAETSQAPAHIRRDICRSLDLPANQVQVKSITNTTYRTNVANYIVKNRMYDILWREGHALKPLYLVNMTQEEFDSYRDINHQK